jgi:hypothetical protein
LYWDGLGEFGVCYELLVIPVTVVTFSMLSAKSLKALNDDGEDDKFAFGCIRYHAVET